MSNKKFFIKKLVTLAIMLSAVSALSAQASSLAASGQRNLQLNSQATVEQRVYDYTQGKESLKITATVTPDFYENLATGGFLRLTGDFILPYVELKEKGKKFAYKDNVVNASYLPGKQKFFYLSKSNDGPLTLESQYDKAERSSTVAKASGTLAQALENYEGVHLAFMKSGLFFWLENKNGNLSYKSEPASLLTFNIKLTKKLKLTFRANSGQAHLFYPATLINQED